MKGPAAGVEKSSGRRSQRSGSVRESEGDTPRGGGALLTASLVARLSLGVSSDCEPAAQPVAPSRGSWSLAPLFSVRCLVTMS